MAFNRLIPSITSLFFIKFSLSSIILATSSFYSWIAFYFLTVYCGYFLLDKYFVFDADFLFIAYFLSLFILGPDDIACVRDNNFYECWLNWLMLNTGMLVINVGLT